ncbi:MAG: hypothetical protein ACI8W8_003251 [Rhodothermales bacterium]|jgi:hypothetical protein
MKKPESILAAISFGQESDAVLHQAASIATRLETPLRLLHVDCHLAGGHPLVSAEDRLETARMGASIDGATCETVKLTGDPLQTIAETLGKNDLLVIGGGQSTEDVNHLALVPAAAVWELCRPILVLLHDGQEELVCAIARDACACQRGEADALAEALGLTVRIVSERPVTATRHLPCECYYG